MDPESAEARSALGLAYLNAWRWQDAWRYLTDARARDTSIAATYLGFALYYAALGDGTRALESLSRADDLDP